MMARSVFMLTAGIFCFVHSHAVRRKSDTTHQDVAFFRGVSLPLAKKSKAGRATALYLSRCDFKKRKAKAAAFIQGKIEAHLLRKLIVHDSIDISYCCRFASYAFLYKFYLIL